MLASSDFHVFTTLLVREGQPQFLDDHLERLTEHATHFGFTCPSIVVLRSSAQQSKPGTFLLRMALDRTGHISMGTRELNPPRSYEAAPVVITDIEVDSSFAAYKTSNRTPYLRAQNFATQQGAFEALLVDADGHVVDGTRSSALLFDGNTLISLEGGFKGITRERVLHEALKLGIPILREKRKAHELQGVLLVAGSGMGLVPAQVIHDRRVKNLIEHFKPI